MTGRPRRPGGHRNTVIAGILAGGGLLALVGGGPAPRDSTAPPAVAPRQGPERCALAWRLAEGVDLPPLPHVVVIDEDTAPTGTLELGRTLLRLEPELAATLRARGRWTQELPGLGRLRLRFTPGGDCSATVEGEDPA